MAQQEQNPRWLLVTDVDDTLVGDDAALAEFVEVVTGSPLLVSLNSSRPIASIRQTLAQRPVDFTPDAIIGAMGTEVQLRGEIDTAWTERFANWDRSVFDRCMDELGAKPHADEFQTPYKASFDVPLSMRRAAQTMIQSCDSPCKLVISGERDFDVLPPNADKGDATVYLAEALGVGLERLIVAGDSGNDLAMFEAAKRGIVVANARHELRSRVDRRRTYLASRSHAAGLLEGLRYWGALD